MRFTIRHESKGRIRISLTAEKMTYHQADLLEYYLYHQVNVTSAKVYERTADAVICYSGNRAEMIALLQKFGYDSAENAKLVPDHTGRQLNAEYQETLIGKVVLHYSCCMLLPMPVRAAIAVVKSARYIWQGIRCLGNHKIEVRY